MKTRVSIAIVLFFTILTGAMADTSWAGTVQDVKEGSKAAAKEIKEGAVETGKAFVETGKKIKEGSKETWKGIKKGVTEAGEDFKKAFDKEKETK